MCDAPGLAVEKLFCVRQMGETGTQMNEMAYNYTENPSLLMGFRKNRFLFQIYCTHFQVIDKHTV